MAHFHLADLVASPDSPGAKNFPPFIADSALEEEAVRCIARFPEGKQRSATLPLLNYIQHRHGFITAAAMEWVAKRLGIEPIHVLEVVTFYPGFRQYAPGRFHIRVCRTLSCAMRGSHELMSRLCELTGIDASSLNAREHPIAVSPDGKWSVEYSECLACCGSAPVCLVNDTLHENAVPEKAQAILDQYPS